MTKKEVGLTIEENVLKKAKKQIPNLSAFFEECLIQYLGLADGIYPTANDREILDKIGKLQAELYMRNQNFNIHENIRKAEEEKINRALRGAWHEYSKTFRPEGDAFNNAVSVLNIDAEKLEDMLDFADMYRDELGLNFTWSKLYELYENEEK